MARDWKTTWNERYSEPEYAYGTQPNVYLKEQLDKLQPGMILFGAEGEGRNAVYAARQGWTVSAFDISDAGRKKAWQLAEAYGVNVDYRVGQLPELDFLPGQFDAIALIYAHFPAGIRAAYHRLLDTFLKPGGTIVLEAFGKQHLPYRERNPDVGGPRDRESLFSTEDIRQDFPGYEIRQLEEMEVELHEGKYHNGLGSVVRFVGRKPAG